MKKKMKRVKRNVAHVRKIREWSAPFVHLLLSPFYIFPKKEKKPKWNTKNLDDETNKLTTNFFFVSFKNKKKTKQTKYTVCICMIIQKSYNGFLCRWFLYQIERIKRRWNEMRGRAQQYRTLTTKQQIERELFDWLGRMRGQATKLSRWGRRQEAQTDQRKWEKEFDWKSGFPFFFHQHKDVRLLPLRPFQDDLMAKPIRHPEVSNPSTKKKKKPFLDPPSSSTQLKTIIGWPPFKPNQ